MEPFYKKSECLKLLVATTLILSTARRFRKSVRVLIANLLALGCSMREGNYT